MPLSKAKMRERKRLDRLTSMSNLTSPVLLLPEKTLTNQSYVKPKIGYYNPTPWFGHIKNKMYADKFFRDVCSNNAK